MKWPEYTSANRDSHTATSRAMARRMACDTPSALHGIMRTLTKRFMIILMASCTTVNGKPKVKHPDKASARMHAHQVRKHQLHDVQAYRCPKCRYWHVGRIPARAKAFQEQKRAEKRIDAMVGQLIGILKLIINKSQ